MSSKLCSARALTTSVVAMAWNKKTVVEDPFFKMAKVRGASRARAPCPIGRRRRRLHGASLPACCPQKEGYVSRAAFKLKEVQKKHKVITTGRQEEGGSAGQLKPSAACMLPCKRPCLQVPRSITYDALLLRWQGAGPRMQPRGVDASGVPGDWTAGEGRFGARHRHSGGEERGEKEQEHKEEAKRCGWRVDPFPPDHEIMVNTDEASPRSLSFLSCCSRWLCPPSSATTGSR